MPNVKRGDGRLGFGYGAVSFMGGCGDAGMEPHQIRLGSTPALMDSTTDMYQVIWPATIDKDESIYSVAGFDVPKRIVLETARDLEATTR